MTEKNKPMTFEEWFNENGRRIEERICQLERCFNDARIGYIPADRAIEVPSDWPKWADCAALFWLDDDDPRSTTGMAEFAGVRVSRPVPAFVPVCGDPVFFMYNDCLMVGKVVQHHRNGLDVECNGEIFPCQDSGVKKFDPSKIGLPWSEI